MSTLSNRFSLFFYLKKQNNSKGNHTVYMRLSINGKRTEICTKREWDQDRWNNSAGRAKGFKEDVKILNNFLDLLRSKVYEAQHELIRDGVAVTGEAIKNKLISIEEESHTLVSVVKEHNKAIEKLIGKGYAKGTWTKYETTLKHVEAFLKKKYHVKDIDISQLKYSFITDFEFYLRTEKDIDTNTNGKYIKNLKKILNECVAKEWLDKNPFANFKVKHVDPEVPHLSKHELELIEAKEFKNERLSMVKDLFIFSCYTGFAYIDASKLTPENIHIGIDGGRWLMKNRQKTDIAAHVPILPKALAIIEKYKDHPKACSKGLLLPMLSNQKVNSYLKEISDQCGIDKEITFHVARHTFATTVTLSNGVPIETVSKMLGHKKIQTTQIYAKVLDSKVSLDMKILERKFQSVTVDKSNDDGAQMVSG
jgi:site-specific recombinase XerD